jgi:hypothetical protein
MKQKQVSNVNPFRSTKFMENELINQETATTTWLVSTTRNLGVRLWHVALVAFGMFVLALWIAALWIEQMLGHLPPLIVAALPEKYHRVLLSMAATTVRARNAMNQKEEQE